MYIDPVCEREVNRTTSNNALRNFNVLIRKSELNVTTIIKSTLSDPVLFLSFSFCQ